MGLRSRILKPEIFELLDNTGLCEVRTSGGTYTWTNGQVFSHIDKALVNPCWMTTMQQTRVEILEPGFSDHSPICMNFTQTIQIKPRPFIFMNHLSNHDDFLARVAEGWSKSEIEKCKTRTKRPQYTGVLKCSSKY